MRTIWMTRKNADMTEGRGPMVDVAAFSKESDARNFIDGKPGVMGRVLNWSKEKYGDWEADPITVYDTISEYEDDHTKLLKEKALAKLTSEERRILGF